MKTYKKTILFMSLMLITMSGFSQAHVTMSLNKIKSTSNIIEYDLFIVNDGQDVLKLSALSFGINFDQAILNDGTLRYSYIDKSKDQVLAPLTTYSTSVSLTDHHAQLKMTSTPIGIEKAILLEKNKPYKVGRFRVANSADWTPDSNPSFIHQEKSSFGLTSSLMLGYVGTNTKSVALIPTLGTVTTSVENLPVLNQSAQGKTNNLNSLNKDEIKINLYPIPATDHISIDFQSVNQADLFIVINDMKGHMVKKVITQTHEGLNKIDLALNDLVSGAYTIQLRSNHQLIYTSTFVKL